MAADQRERPSETLLKNQLKRLAFYYGYDDVKFELLRVFKKLVMSVDHAERIITLILDTRRPNENGFVSCPTPAELSDYAAQVPPVLNQYKGPDGNCPACGGTGFRITEHRGMTGAEKCLCTRADSQESHV